ncbi:MAG: hypothetical protein JNJ97_02040 [Alphaproteobacteria bacterium]|nr:hypothetical protein [Alphaproteobacteria bacterium]MCA0450464.1 hypothetical protein [Pseudomonadota bacterium]
MRALALLLALIAMPAFAQERPPVDVRFEFEKLAAQMEVLLDRPLDDDLRKALRERLASIVTRLEAGREDDNAAQVFRLERRLAQLRASQTGTFDNIPPGLYEAYRRVIQDEIERTREALRALGRDPG